MLQANYTPSLSNQYFSGFTPGFNIKGIHPACENRHSESTYVSTLNLNVEFHMVDVPP